ncbi:unnamed protein product [Ceutorhynchus assimilis]|uniref:Transmembrane protein 39A n=1 Tax=Ceutorhynchus assimilis TaxID=467358 RepID=A0A9N9MYQ0_9CUCU|nr:unnamed protein product [Ceutorhynchus assimilis]
MPSGARRLSRAGRTNSQGDSGTLTKGIPILLIPTMEAPDLPKHFPFPSLFSDSDLFFDFIMALYAFTGTGIQFMHLYRSVWWLPNSFTQNAINFYLIDVNLVILIGLIFARRLYFQVGCKMISKMYSNKTSADLSYLSRSILSLFYAIVIGILATIVLGTRSKMDIIYLFYPILLYVPIFGSKVRPFFEVSSWCSNGIQPIHACSSNPSDIRRECELLKVNLLDRLRQIFFTAAINAYYGCFIPCCFAQPELVYDKWWNIEQGTFIFTGSLIFSFTHMIPLRYCDILHKAVLHSGMWERFNTERNNVAIVIHDWRDDVLWPGGALVKYNKAIWRAIGDCNSIAPGDRALTWGYFLFILPSYPLALVCLFQAVVIFYQLYICMYSTYWYRIISLTLMVFFNYSSLYKLLRDCLVSYKIYKQTEESDDDKYTSSDYLNDVTSNYKSNIRTEEFPFESTVSDDEAGDR